VVSIETQELSRIPLPEHEGNACFDVSVSPDERSLAYIEATACGSEVTRLWVVDASGGEPIPVTDGMASAWNPIWTADGNSLLFVSNRQGSADLWQQRLDDTGMPVGKPIPLSTALGIQSVTFSRDGKKLACSRGRWHSNVWRVQIQNGGSATWEEAEQLTFDTSSVDCVDLSPDGTRLAVSSDRSGNREVWILPAEGGEMTQLTTNPALDDCPRWSPDGKQIAFFSSRSGNRDIWVMPVDGGPARQLTSHPAEDLAMTWSPSGREIAFMSKRSGNRDIWIVASAGGEPRQLTTDPADDYVPAWSPDGEWLVVPRSGGLFRIPSEGGEGELLTVEAGSGWGARFSPDGRQLFYQGAGERSSDIFALSLEDAREYPVTHLANRRGSMEFNLATDGGYLYFIWAENFGDLWVMDIVTDGEE